MHSALKSDVSNTLQQYFEIKAALPLGLTALMQSTLQKNAVSFSGLVSEDLELYSGKRTSRELFEKIIRFSDDGSLAYNIFLTQISNLERFCGDYLSHKQVGQTGTLGQILSAMKAHTSDPENSEIVIMNEILERRNCLIHNHGLANQKYVTASQSPHVPNQWRSATLGQSLTMISDYILYASESIVRYSQQFTI